MFPKGKNSSSRKSISLGNISCFTTANTTMFLRDHNHVLKELDCICPIEHIHIFFREQNPFSKNRVLTLTLKNVGHCRKTKDAYDNETLWHFIQNENYHKKRDMQKKKPNLGAKKGIMNLQDEFGGEKMQPREYINQLGRLFF